MVSVVVVPLWPTSREICSIGTPASDSSETKLWRSSRGDHMAEVERDWFQTRFAGAQVGYLYCTSENMDAEFDVGTADAESDLSAYTCEVEAARR
jgi:hypothetical protein